MTEVIPEGCLWDLGEPAFVDSDAEPNDVSSDVLIVGAGFTGLWTAYYLRVLAPHLSITILEKHRIGFGASGRNGGWASALLPMSVQSLVTHHGVEATRSTFATMNAAVDEIVGHGRAWGIGDTISKGGWIQLAHSVAQLDRLYEQIRVAEELGIPEALGVVLGADEARSKVDSRDSRGGLFDENCAAIHPGTLVRTLGNEVRRRGVTIIEGVSVLAIEPGGVLTDRGPMRAPIVLRATEAFTASMTRMRRRIVPLYSLMVATEPLPREVIDSIISPSRPTFNDARHLIVYGQRTPDDRIAFGGRGAPYHMGSRISPDFDHDQRVAGMLVSTLRDMFPVLSQHQFTHHWGGPLGAPRDWHCSVQFDPATGLGHAGGYVGDGVTTTNVSARALVDLVLGRDTPLAHLPWIGHRHRSWEPEPVRWIAINALTRLAAMADARECSSGRRAHRIEWLLDRVLGH